MPTLQCGGLETYYIAPWGLPTLSAERLVLLVHGAGGSHRHWEPLLSSLRLDGFFPVALDLPGHGQSGGTVLATVSAIADFLNAFLDALAIAQPICLVGHSAGGLLALQFAWRYPKRVDQLMLIATSAWIQLHPDFLQQAITGNWDYLALQQSFAPDIPTDLQQLVLNEFQYVRLAADAVDFMDLSQTDLRAILPTMQVPTLILTGDDDVIISPRKSKLLQRDLPTAELVTVPGAGHYVQVEQAATVAATLTHFLQSSRLATC